MRVTDVAAAVVVDHDAIVEEVVFETAILPAFCLALEVVGEEADEFVDGGGCCSGGGRAGHGEGHVERSSRAIIRDSHRNVRKGPWNREVLRDLRLLPGRVEIEESTR